MSRGIAPWILFILAGNVLAEDIDTVIEKTLARYGNLNSFYAKFTQTFCDEVSGVCQDFSGEINFLKPNFFRMKMNDPEQIYVGDSVSLWIYIPDRKKAIRQHLDQTPFAINPDMFLKDYHERFNASMNESDNGFEIILTPKEETEIYEKIVVQISRKNFDITGIAITDEAGAQNKFVFSSIKINKKISRDMFVFKPPKGTEIIEQ
jgi:outer membrane lipoprotein carrier protein